MYLYPLKIVKKYQICDMSLERSNKFSVEQQAINITLFLYDLVTYNPKIHMLI